MKFARGNVVALVPDLIDIEPQSSGIGLPGLDSLSGGEPRGAPLTGIKALMFAVLAESIRNYLGRNERFYHDAAYWIASTSGRSPFAFGTVCETLGLEPSAVRSALQRLREKNLTSREAIGRTRPNVRHSGRLLVRKAG